jgi:hypothetical protein
MSFLTPSGHWHPTGHQPLVPVDNPHDPHGVGAFTAPDPYNNAELQRGQVADAAPQDNAWQGVKFSFGAWARDIATHLMPMAEWPAYGRGADVQRVQRPGAMAGNVNATELAVLSRTPSMPNDPTQAQLVAQLSSGTPTLSTSGTGTSRFNGW